MKKHTDHFTPQDLDRTGSLISGVRIDPEVTYLKVSDLLQRYLKGDLYAWIKITEQIDYLYNSFQIAMAYFTKESNFLTLLDKKLRSGKKLVFKPNIVAPLTIDPTTYGSVEKTSICTEWVIVAAVMRWFHDKCDIDYSCMALAEGSTLAATLAASYSQDYDENIPSETVLEGHFHDMYGGWGFYFVRKYLSCHTRNTPSDDPMNGFEESCSGTYLTPGEAKNKLMIYDINKISDRPSKGRFVPVPHARNYNNIMLHKVIVGGNPKDLTDCKRYPGCVLINLPKLKMHGQDLITNAIKNIGIGLYPSLCKTENNTPDDTWLYASPDRTVPNLKAKLPHSPMVMEMDSQTHLPCRNQCGKYIIHHTHGFNGTELDIIKAVQCQDVLMLHISDCVHPLNLNHDHGNLAQTSPEGYLWISNDCVALDNFCAHYCFKMISRHDAILKSSTGKKKEFLQKVPVVTAINGTLCTEDGYDSPLSRYDLYRQAQKRDIGCCRYHVTGYDLNTKEQLGSCHGHLVSINKNILQEHITKTLFYNTNTILHDLQATFLSYAKANDQLCHTHLYQKIMCLFDQNQDGIIDYNEKGRGYENAQFGLLSYTIHLLYTDANQYLRALFMQSVMYLKYAHPATNADGHDFLMEKNLLTELLVAYQYSLQPTITQDPNLPKNTYGNGHWPCYATAKQLYMQHVLYNGSTLDTISLSSLYGLAFQYCDKTCNEGNFTGSIKQKTSRHDALTLYSVALRDHVSPLPFTLYVPISFGTFDNHCPIPNVEETNDKNLIYTAVFHELKENKYGGNYVSF